MRKTRQDSVGVVILSSEAMIMKIVGRNGLASSASPFFQYLCS
jgi:hypothetical protein